MIILFGGLVLVVGYVLYGKGSLENKIPQKGVGSEEGLCHEYEEITS